MKGNRCGKNVVENGQALAHSVPRRGLPCDGSQQAWPNFLPSPLRLKTINEKRSRNYSDIMNIKVFMLLTCFASGLVLVEATDHANIEKYDASIRYPTDLLAQGTRGATPFTLDFVLHRYSDLRLMYCDPKTLQSRISAGVCVIDFVQWVPYHQEVKVSPNSSLLQVLEDSGLQDFKGWNGTGGLSIRVIGRRAILVQDGSKFPQTKISPGDFIVVLPIS